MKKVTLFLFVAILATSCYAQNPEPKGDTLAKTQINEKENNTPIESWKVKKELDENGNIIRYDSIYTWSSSKNLQDMSGKEKDSIFKDLHSRIQQRFSFSKSDDHIGLLEKDSILKQIFSDDFFSCGMSKGFPTMEDMMKQMEAMHQQFYNNRHRYIIPPEKIHQNNNLKNKSI